MPSFASRPMIISIDNIFNSLLRMLFHFDECTAWPISIISLACESGLETLLLNNRITSHFEANTAKLICNN